MTIISKVKRSFIVGTVIILSGGSVPMATFADPSTQCTPPAPTQPGVYQPVGADASTYTYDCTTGLWENNYYTFDPSTGVYSPVTPIVYTYDPTTGLYDYSTWIYLAPKKTYESEAQTINQPPAGTASSDIIGGPSAPQTDPSGSDGISNTGPDSNNSIDSNGQNTDGSIDGTGPNSENSLNGNGSTDTSVNDANNATLNNTLNQQANTGDSAVLSNTTAGSAGSGNAQDIANVENLLQSSSSLGNDPTTFVANINGDVDGNLLLDPSTLGTIQPTSPSTSTDNGSLTVNNATNAAINNNINVGADTGNATVADNTTGGNATSGNASAIADVVNLIDSAISSGKSFVGVININGNFNGDILVPPNLINQLIADNVPTVNINTTGPGSNNTVNNGTETNTTNVNNTNNEGINNNVDAAATTGQAAVSDNTSAGSATTGNANTNITAFNLTGSNVVGANDLLVFVNVLGSWVGMIVNAPPGATAAELGGGITSDTANGSNTTNVNNNTNQSINNNINANAQSGNADVSSNTTGGNATSGNADSAVNLLNVENSNLSLSGWFGILFINVFGAWHGNFGIEPSPGNFAGGTTGSTSNSSNSSVPAAVQVFRFVPTGGSGGGSNNGDVNTVTNSSNQQTTNDSLLAAHIVKGSASQTPQLTSNRHSLLYPIIGVIIFFLLIFGDKMHTIWKTRRNSTK